MSPKDSIHWQALEYEYHEKTADWFWALGIITIALSAIAVLLNNILFAIFILLGAATLALYAVRKPELVSFEINNRGIVINKTLYPYSTLESFGIETDGPPKILVKSKKMFVPYLVMPVSEEAIDFARTYLLQYLEEQEHREPFSVKLMEYLGF
jgi:hypothetical protein